MTKPEIQGFPVIPGGIRTPVHKVMQQLRIRLRTNA